MRNCAWVRIHCIALFLAGVKNASWCCQSPPNYLCLSGTFPPNEFRDCQLRQSKSKKQIRLKSFTEHLRDRACHHPIPFQFTMPISHPSVLLSGSCLICCLSLMEGGKKGELLWVLGEAGPFWSSLHRMYEGWGPFRFLSWVRPKLSLYVIQHTVTIIELECRSCEFIQTADVPDWQFDDSHFCLWVHVRRRLGGGGKARMLDVEINL